MADKNSFVQFAGQFQSVAGEITRRRAERGGNIIDSIAQLAQPANVWALDEIDAVLAKLANVFRVKIGGRRTIADVVAASGYTSYDRSILERCVFVQGWERWTTVEIFSIEHFDHEPSDAEIEDEYVRRGLKRPEVDHAVHFGDQYRDLPVEGHPVIFYLKDPVPGADGRRYVLYLWRFGANRKLGWYWLCPGHRWYRDCLFAGVRE